MARVRAGVRVNVRVLIIIKADNNYLKIHYNVFL